MVLEGHKGDRLRNNSKGDLGLVFGGVSIDVSIDVSSLVDDSSKQG